MVGPFGGQHDETVGAVLTGPVPIFLQNALF